jgi:hypothetical protein
MNERRYLSIGEVLGLLLEEFPDVTISKIRFLESQGLIDPERTASGYRKFYDEDVERLRVILREQRENFLPLRVIKDRLETGEIARPDPSGSIRLPRSSTRGASGSPPPLAASQRRTSTTHIVTPQTRMKPPVRSADAGSDDTAPLRAAARAHPAAAPPQVPTGPPAASVAATESVPTRSSTFESAPIDASTVWAPEPSAATIAADGTSGAPAVRPESGLTAEELCSQAGVDEAFLDSLEEFGLVVSGRVGGWRTYDGDSVRAVVAAAQLCRRGLEPRHLRLWRQTVDKELALIEQMVLPLLRQHNPAAREHAAEVALDIERLGEELRAALASKALRHLIG